MKKFRDPVSPLVLNASGIAVAPMHNLAQLVKYYAVIPPTTRRTHGATIATVGNATGQVVIQLFSHCAGNSESIPCDMARTKAETMHTIIAESRALNRMGA